MMRSAYKQQFQSQFTNATDSGTWAGKESAAAATSGVLGHGSDASSSNDQQSGQGQRKKSRWA